MAASDDDYDKEVVDGAASIQPDIDDAQNTGRTMDEADEAPIDRQIIAPTVDEKAQDKIDSKANEEMAASNDDYDKEIVDEIQSTGRTMNEDDDYDKEVVDGAASIQPDIDDAQNTGRTMDEADEAPI
eukprot:769828_1